VVEDEVPVLDEDELVEVDIVDEEEVLDVVDVEIVVFE
jgi:hypothetical protein